MTRPQEAAMEVRRVRPTVRLVRLKIDGAGCSACGRPLRRGDLVRIDGGKLIHSANVPCVPAWERT